MAAIELENIFNPPPGLFWVAGFIEFRGSADWTDGAYRPAYPIQGVLNALGTGFVVPGTALKVQVPGADIGVTVDPPELILRFQLTDSSGAVKDNLSNPWRLKVSASSLGKWDIRASVKILGFVDNPGVPAGTLKTTDLGITVERLTDAAVTRDKVAVLEGQNQIFNRAALVAYAGPSSTLIVQSGSAVGVWTRDDSATANGGSVLSGVAPRKWVKQIRLVSVVDFGADSSGAADSTVPIQLAIDSGIAELHFPAGNYKISGDGASYVGKGSGLGLKLRSNLRLYGPGVLKPVQTGFGNYAVLSNPVGPITDLKLEIKLDCSLLTRNPASPQSTCSGVALYDATECNLDKLRVISPPANGIMLRAGPLGINLDNRLRDCTVSGAGYIGIQVQRPTRIQITGNKSLDSGDNGIDIEGNDVSGGFANAGFGGKNVVSDNIIDGALTGIFLESMGNTIVSQNYISETTIGIDLNRINSGALDNSLTGNRIVNKVKTNGVAALRIKNSSGRTAVDGNHFEGFPYSISFPGGGGSYVTIGHNTHDRITVALIQADRTVNSITFSQIYRQTYLGGTTANGYPRLISPVFESLEVPGRTFQVGIEDAISLVNNAPIPRHWYRAKFLTATNAAWGSASIFFGGKTLINIPGSVLGIGDVLKIREVYYRVTAQAGPEITVSNLAGAFGDYSAAINPPGADVFTYTLSVFNDMQTQ